MEHEVRPLEVREALHFLRGEEFVQLPAEMCLHIRLQRICLRFWSVHFEAWQALRFPTSDLDHVERRQGK